MNYTYSNHIPSKKRVNYTYSNHIPAKKRVNDTIFKPHPSKHLHNICTTMNYEAEFMAINMRCTVDVVMTTQVLKKHLFRRIKLSTAVNMIFILFLHTRSCLKYISICLCVSGSIELKRVNYTYSNQIPAKNVRIKHNYSNHIPAKNV